MQSRHPRQIAATNRVAAPVCAAIALNKAAPTTGGTPSDALPFRLRVRGLHSYTRLSWIPHKQVSRTEEQNPVSYESGKSRTMYTKID
ncbi:hypothetical protein GW17_00061314 [Ensete ventricosum]|nr:hypothetical protein GW17_00061314 [Ensete ventricosum]